MPDKKKDVRGSARKGSIDTRSTDVRGQQADEVASHAERADTKPAPSAGRDEAKGALKDETAR